MWVIFFVPQGGEGSVQALFNGFAGSMGQTTNQAQHFHHPQVRLI